MVYTIRVATSRNYAAGTDRNVYLILIGENGEESHMIELTRHITGNALERSADEIFAVNCEHDLGKVVKIKLSKDKTDDWECDFIEVTRAPEPSRINVNYCLTGSDGWKEFSVK